MSEPSAEPASAAEAPLVFAAFPAAAVAAASAAPLAPAPPAAYAGAALTATPPARGKGRQVTLEDGTVLKLTISRKSLFQDMTGMGAPVTLADCMILLYLCSRDVREHWSVPPPPATEDGEQDAAASRGHYAYLRGAIDEWADETFSPDDASVILDLAYLLWTGQHAPQVVAVEDSAGDSFVESQKKREESSPTGPPSTPTSSAEGTSPAGT